MRLSSTQVALFALFTTILVSPTAFAQLQPTPSPKPKAPTAEQSMEVQAFKEFLKVASLGQASDLLLANIPCGAKTCIQMGLSGISRNLLVGRLSGLIAGFGYGADIQELSFSSSPADLESVNFQLVLTVGSTRLDSGKVSERTQRFLALLKAVSGLSDTTTRYGKIQDIPSGAHIYLMLSLRWEAQGMTGHVRLISPPKAPKPKPPIATGGCPIWTITDAPSPAGGHFQDWPEYDLQWNFDCPLAPGNLK